MQFDTLVYEPESGAAHVRLKESKDPAAAQWSGRFATAALALEAARARGLQPTAIYYFFGMHQEGTDPHYGSADPIKEGGPPKLKNRPGSVELRPSAANTLHADEATPVGGGHPPSGRL